MFICVCNAVNHHRIEAAIADGHGCADSVYSACGVTPKCRSCACTIETMIRERRHTAAGHSAGAVAPAE